MILTIPSCELYKNKKSILEIPMINVYTKRFLLLDLIVHYFK